MFLLLCPWLTHAGGGQAAAADLCTGECGAAMTHYLDVLDAAGCAPWAAYRYKKVRVAVVADVS